MDADQLPSDHIGHLIVPDSINLRQSGVYPQQTGAWCINPIKEGTLLGPYQGKVVLEKDIKNVDYRYAWQIYDERTNRLLHVLNATRPEDGNWMRYVNCARYFEEQNILAVQEGSDIFYKAIKDIPAGEELLTWFAMNKKKRRRKQNPTDAAVEQKPSGQTNTLDDMMPKVKKRQKKPKLEKVVDPISESNGTKLKPDVKLPTLKKISPVPISTDNITLNSANKLSVSNVSISIVSNGLTTDGARRGTRRKKCKIFTDSILIGEGRIIRRQLKKAMKRDKMLDIKTKIKMAPIASAHEKTVKSETIEIATNKVSDSKEGIEESEKKESKHGDRVEAEVCYRYTLTADQRGMDPSGTPMYMCDVCDVDYRHSFSLKRHYLRCHINYKYLSNHDVLNCMINLKSQTIANAISTVPDSPGDKPAPIKRKRRRSKREMVAAKNGVNIKGDVAVEGKMKCLGDTLPTSTKVQDSKPGLFWCNICNNLFDHLNDLKMHVALHTAEQRPSEYMYSCSKCEQQFSFKETLLDHVCGTKAVNVPEQRDNTFPCSICGKIFTAKVNLRQHLLVHESARHRCKYCGIRYKKPKPLRIHMRKVHHEKFYKCPGCRKWFTSVKRFRDHKKLPKCKDAVVKATGKILETVKKDISGTSPLSKKSSIHQYMSPRKFFMKRIESNEIDVSQNKDSIPIPRRHSPKTKSFKKLCPAVFGLTKSKPCVVCPMCKVKVNGPFSSCTHKRNLDHSDDPMESFLDDSRNDGPNATNECTADFFANVAYNIADNLNMYIDGKCDALTRFAKHIQIEDYTSLFSCPQVEDQQLSLSKYNFPAGLSSLCSFSQEVISEPQKSEKNCNDGMEDIEAMQDLLPLDLSADRNTVNTSESMEPYNRSFTTTVEHNPDGNEKLTEDISSLNFKDDAVCCKAWTANNFGADKSENDDIENISIISEDCLIKSETMFAESCDCALDCTLKAMNATSIRERTEHETACLTSEKKISSPQPDIDNDTLQHADEPREGRMLSDVKEIIDDILNNIPYETPGLSFPNIEGKSNAPSYGLTHTSTNMAEVIPLSHEDIADATSNIPDDFSSSEIPNEEEVPPPLTLMVESAESPSCELDMLSDEDCRSPPLLCMMFSKLERETAITKYTDNLIIEDISDCDSVHSSFQVAECDEPEITISTNFREELALTGMNTQDADPDDEAYCMKQEPSSSASNTESTNVVSDEPLNLVCCDKKKTRLSCSNDSLMKTGEECSMFDPKASTPKDEGLPTNFDSIAIAEEEADWCLISNCTKQFDEIAFGKQGELIYVCDVCARQFQTHLGLLKHQGRKHPSVNCRYLLVEQGHHINELHFPNASVVGVLSQSSIASTCMKIVDKYSCTKCGVQFSSLSRLHVHIISCAPKSDKPPAVSDVKTTEIKLKKKMRDIQSGKGKIRFRLRDLSGYKSTLFKETSIEQNNKIMDNKKRSAAPLPEVDNKKMKGRSYDLPYNPSKHVRRRDMTEVLERQKCSGCGLKFKTISLLERHIRKCSEKDRLRAVKPIISPRYNEKHSKLKHVCKYCHREFTYLKSIVNHYKEFCSVRRVLEQEGKLTASNLKDEAMIAAIVNNQEEQPTLKAPILTEADTESNGKVQKGWLKGRKRKWRKKNHSWTYIKKKKDVENRKKKLPSVKEQPIASGVAVEVTVKHEPTDHHLQPKPEIVLPENSDADLPLPANNGVGISLPENNGVGISLPENNGLDLPSDEQDEQVNLSIENEILPNKETQVVAECKENCDVNVSSENHDVQIRLNMTDSNTFEQNTCLTNRKVFDGNQMTFIKQEPEAILSSVDILDLVDPSREMCASQVTNKPILSLHQCSEHGEIAAQTLLVDSPDSDISR